VAAIDPGTAIPRLLADAGAGLTVPPDDVDALVGAVRSLVDDPERARSLGESGRRWVAEHASPAAVAAAYDGLLRSVTARRRPRGPFARARR